MNRHSGSIVRYGIVLIVSVTLVASAGVASAAVAGTFSSTYDGYDGSETSVQGHEIQVSGTIEISGESAVNPRIEITSSQNTVLDDGTVTLLQPGGSSANFERRYSENAVTYTADEIPAGTTLNLEFVVYPVAGLTSDEITSAQVIVTYARPGGDRTRKTFRVSTSLNATAPQAITAAERQTPEPSAPGPRDWAIRGLAAVGALMLVFIFVVFIWNAVSGDDDDDSSPLD